MNYELQEYNRGEAAYLNLIIHNSYFIIVD